MRYNSVLVIIEIKLKKSDHIEVNESYKKKAIITYM